MDEVLRSFKIWKKQKWIDQSKCRLLQLPAELRHHIYTLCLAPEDTKKRLELRYLQKPALTATCRQIEAEALPIFFANNSFTLTVCVNKQWRLEPLLAKPTRGWVQAAGRNASPLQDVIVGCSYTPTDRRFRDREWFTILPTLRPSMVSTFGVQFAEESFSVDTCLRAMTKLQKFQKENWKTTGSLELDVLGLVRLTTLLIPIHIFHLMVCVERYVGLDRLESWHDLVYKVLRAELT